MNADSAAPTAPTALHTLRATPATVHWGFFDASLAPVLTVRSGDLVQAEAVSSHAGEDPDLMFDAGIEALYRGVPEKDRHPGPHPVEHAAGLSVVSFSMRITVRCVRSRVEPPAP